jgi:hypothetical protein
MCSRMYSRNLIISRISEVLKTKKNACVNCDLIVVTKVSLPSSVLMEPPIRLHGVATLKTTVDCVCCFIGVWFHGDGTAISEPFVWVPGTSWNILALCQFSCPCNVNSGIEELVHFR